MSEEEREWEEIQEKVKEVNRKMALIGVNITTRDIIIPVNKNDKK